LSFGGIHRLVPSCRAGPVIGDETTTISVNTWSRLTMLESARAAIRRWYSIPQPSDSALRRRIAWPIYAKEPHRLTTAFDQAAANGELFPQAKTCH